MSELPSVSGKDVVKAFQRLGFKLARIRGSHHILKRDGHPHLVSVPVHGSQSVKRGTLRGAIAASGASDEDFLAALE